MCSIGMVVISKYNRHEGQIVFINSENTQIRFSRTLPQVLRMSRLTLSCASYSLAQCKAHTPTTVTSDDLRKNGVVSLITTNIPNLPTYDTSYYVELGVWVDEGMLQTTPNAPEIILAYLDKVNCEYAMGKNFYTLDGTHTMSFRLFKNEIRYFGNHSEPKLTSGTKVDVFSNGMKYPVTADGYWIEKTHTLFKNKIDTAYASLGTSRPKINILFTSNTAYVAWNGATKQMEGAGGTSNGIGGGQAIAVVDPNAFDNTGKPDNLDWWGIIASHELGHAMGGTHLAVNNSTMCCDPPATYAGREGYTPSSEVSLDATTWSKIVANNNSTTTTANEFGFIPTHKYLVNNNAALVVSRWLSATKLTDCHALPGTPAEIDCKTVSAYSKCLVDFPWSPVCTQDSAGNLTQPCCMLKFW